MDLHPETQLQMSMCRLREIPQADQQFQSSVYLSPLQKKAPWTRLTNLS